MEGELKHVNAQSLECPVCLGIFKDPKILSCSHTYCMDCLDNLLDCHGNKQKLKCPVCRADTKVLNQDVSMLQSNLALKSLLDDVDNYEQHHICTNCISKERSDAVVYCKDCDKYLCTTCVTKHSQWEDFNDHEVLAITSGITLGTVPVRSRKFRKCRKHPMEDEECFCSDCRRFACFRCVIIEHKGEGHRIIEESVYEGNHLKSVEDLKSKADKRRSFFLKYVNFIDEHKVGVRTAEEQCIDDISEAYEESVRQLTERKDSLIGEVKGLTAEADTELDKMRQEAQQKIIHMTTVTDLVANGTKIPFQTDAVAAHDTLCQELHDAMNIDSFKHTYELSKKGKLLVFERNEGINELLDLGKVVRSVAKNIALPTKDSANSMTATTDGMMAVGSHKGGIEIFSTDGQLQQTVLKNKYIDSLSILSDGRHVVRDLNNIALYDTEWEKLDVRFETLDYIECGRGDLDVDSDDRIYVSYTDAKKIQVFSPEGGKALREIQCNDIEPMQITVLGDLLMIKHRKTVSMIDLDGNVKHRTIKGNLYPTATVTQDNMILIAWFDDLKGLVSIDEYNNRLQHVKTHISDYKIRKFLRNWFHLREFRSGELAFCTPDMLYIFHQHD